MCVQMCVAARDYVCGPHVWTEGCTWRCMLTCVGVCKCVWTQACGSACVTNCSIIPAPLALAALPSPHPLGLSKPTARQCSPLPSSCMRLAALSIRVCLTKRKLNRLGGPLYLVLPAPAHCAVILTWGLSLLPLPQYAVSLGALGSERGPRWAPPGRALAPHPARSTP